MSQLVGSMQKLLTRLISSKHHQEEVFQSLSQQDIRKIVRNLSDHDAETRIVSLQLLFRLIYGNQRAKTIVCESIGVSALPGRIVVNSEVATLLAAETPERLKNVFTALKAPIDDNQTNFLFWYVPARQTATLTPKNQSSNPSSPAILQWVLPSQQINLDPKWCLVGFVINPSRQQPLTNSIILASNQHAHIQDWSYASTSQSMSAKISITPRNVASQIPTYVGHTRVITELPGELESRHTVRPSYKPTIDYGVRHSLPNSFQTKKPATGIKIFSTTETPRGSLTLRDRAETSYLGYTQIGQMPKTSNTNSSMFVQPSGPINDNKPLNLLSSSTRPSAYSITGTMTTRHAINPNQYSIMMGSSRGGYAPTVSFREVPQRKVLSSAPIDSSKFEANNDFNRV